jgi:hypothetical protein
LNLNPKYSEGKINALEIAPMFLIPQQIHLEPKNVQAMRK